MDRRDRRLSDRGLLLRLVLCLVAGTGCGLQTAGIAAGDDLCCGDLGGDADGGGPDVDADGDVRRDVDVVRDDAADLAEADVGVDEAGDVVEDPGTDGATEADEGPDAPDGAGDGAEDDAFTDDGAVDDAPADDAAVDEAEAISCDPGGSDDHCAGDVLNHCRPDGAGWNVDPCPFGCTGYGLAARCFMMQPSNVTDPDLLWAGTAAFAPTGVRLVLFETDTGAIRAWNTAGTELTPLRAAGTGDVSGIRFTTQPQGATGAPELAIWSVTSFTVPAGVDVIGGGARAMVVMSSGDVRVNGTVHVGGSLSFVLGPTRLTFDRPGPGGAAGGTAQNRGGGSGGGAGGSEADWPHDNVDSGGGGGAFGGGGGSGATVSGQGGGAGGITYGTQPLVPLLGGSGGGGGGDGNGGRGGHGAGALEIVSATGIWVAAGGGIGAEGGFGAGGGNGGGGGGGGSGGAILLEAYRVDVSGVVAANGGSGGAGAHGSSSGGASGQNGLISTFAAPGGAGGGSGTSGGAGSSAAVVGGTGGQDSDSDDDGGGGGGGSGRIRLNAIVHAVGGSVSPAESTTITTRGTINLL